MFKNTTESMGLKEKTINFLLFSGTTKRLRNHQKTKEPKNNSYAVVFSEFKCTISLLICNLFLLSVGAIDYWNVSLSHIKKYFLAKDTL